MDDNAYLAETLRRARGGDHEEGSHEAAKELLERFAMWAERLPVHADEAALCKYIGECLDAILKLKKGEDSRKALQKALNLSRAGGRPDEDKKFKIALAVVRVLEADSSLSPDQAAALVHDTMYPHTSIPSIKRYYYGTHGEEARQYERMLHRKD